jgi:uncharacterized coiled-coil protein SlyX
MGNETLQKQVAEQGKEIAKLRKQVDTMRYVLNEMRKVVLEMNGIEPTRKEDKWVEKYGFTEEDFWRYYF